MARQPKRILSTRARSLAGTTRVATNERKRLQNAINRMQKDIDDYNASIQKRKKEKGMWNFLSKAGSVLSTVGAATANPIIAGIGVGATAIGSAKEYQKEDIDFCKQALQAIKDGKEVVYTCWY